MDISNEQMRALIETRCRGRGNLAAFAKECGYTSPHMGDIIRGHRSIPPAVAQQLGYDLVETEKTWRERSRKEKAG